MFSMQDFYENKTVAIDVMGGDNAPEEIVKGLKAFMSSGPSFLLFGDKNKIEPLVKEHLAGMSKIEIVHSESYIPSDLPVMSALRLAKTSSMGMAIQAVKDNRADVAVSAGNTGVLMALSKIILKTINGVDRPALAATIPGRFGKSIVLDLGANAECSVRNLVEFSIMGEALARAIFMKENPSVALLNIGSENIKGSQLVKNSAELLSEFFENYVGYIEGNQLVDGEVDVVVTDGFSGNIALKSIEGTAKLILEEFKTIFKSSFLSKVAAAILMKSLKNFSNKYNPKLHNGAIFLGLNGLVVKAHGNSDALAIEHAIRFATDILRSNILERIRSQLESNAIFAKMDSV